MIDNIILKTDYHKAIDIKPYIKEWDLEEKVIRTSSVVHQLEILHNFSKLKDTFVYLQMYASYADGIGQLEIPYWYDGRVIIPKKLSSTVLEFVYNAQMNKQEYRNFIYNIFSSTGIYLSELTPQQMQEYYYDPSEQDVVNYLKNFIAFIDIDNDGSYMKLMYNPKKISQYIIKRIEQV